MRIGHFCSSLDPSLGGVSSGIPDITKELTKNGIQNWIFSFGNTRNQLMECSKIFLELNTKGIQCMYTIVRFKNNYGVGSFRKLRSKLASFKVPDLVVLHQIYTFSTIIGYFYARKNCIPYAVFPHGSLTKYHETDNKLMKYFAKMICFSHILNKADAIIVTCEGEKIDLPPKFQSKVVEIRYGTTKKQLITDSAISSPEVGLNPRIVYSGRFDKKKNIPLVIKAMPIILIKYPELILDIAGSGTDKEVEELNQLIDSLGLKEHIEFHGWLEYAKMLNLFAGAKLLVLPSENENFAIVVADALSTGLPCVVSKFVGTADIVAKYGAGEIIHELTSISVADGILRVLQGDELSYREAAFKAVEQSLDWSKIASRWRDLVTSLS